MGSAGQTLLCVISATTLLMSGCGDDDTEGGGASGASGGSGGGGEGGSELEAPCPQGQAPVDGTCQAVGATSCASGFVSDGEGGCRAVLPDAACGTGEMALPGEAACRPIMDCGDAPWGNIPIDATTHYVDVSYAGGNSDGSESAPWTTLQQAIDSAPSGGVIAIAEGQYSQATLFLHRSVRMFGRCPSLVEIVAPDSENSNVQIDGQGAELRGVAITGGRGVLIATEDVALDSVWIHDTTAPGISVIDPIGPSSVRMSNSLMEDTYEAAILVSGAIAELDGVVIREVLPGIGGRAGLGVGLLVSPVSDLPSILSVSHSVLEQLHGAGIVMDGGDAHVERSAIRDVLPQELDMDDGQGIGASAYTSGPASLTVQDCVIERTHEAGILVVGSDAEVRGTTVRDTRGAAGGSVESAGVAVQATGQTPASLLIEDCSIRQSGVAGLLVVDASVEAARLLVADAASDGVLVLSTGAPATAHVVSSNVSNVTRAGLSSFGGTFTMSNNQLWCNPIQLNGEMWSNLQATFLDEGGNRCGCGDTPEPCRVQAGNLQPPGSI